VGTLVISCTIAAVGFFVILDTYEDGDRDGDGLFVAYIGDMVDGILVQSFMMSTGFLDG
jgi:hypothetical protein